MTTQEIISPLTAFGLGSIIGIFIKNILDKRKELNFKLNEINESKYRSILIYMSLTLNPKNKDHFKFEDGGLNNLKTDEEIINYAKVKISVYYYHSLLYAPDIVIKKIKDFISQPSNENYIKVAKVMRVNLWNKKSKLTEEEILMK